MHHDRATETWIQASNDHSTLAAFLTDETDNVQVSVYRPARAGEAEYQVRNMTEGESQYVTKTPGNLSVTYPTDDPGAPRVSASFAPRILRALALLRLRSAGALLIYDPSGHAQVEVTDRDVVASSVKTWRGDGTANVNFELTAHGQTSFLRLTRSLARRGATLHGAQHFAIAIRGRVYSRPFIDYRLTPDGLDAKTGLVIANVPPKEAKRVADALRGVRR